MFDSANPSTEYPRFAIAFVCKLRSKIYRQQHTNPSQWFIFRKVSSSRVDVLDKNALLVNYGFDIGKFFDSDLFKKSLPLFEKTLKKGLADARKWASSSKRDGKEAQRYIKAIEEALPLLKTTKQVNDKYFKLTDLDSLDKAAEEPRISPELKQKILAAKLAAMEKKNKKFMKKVA